MRCCEGFSLIYALYPNLKMVRPHFRMLALLDSEVSQLLLVFKRISSQYKDHEFVDIANVMAFFNVGENKFMNKAFSCLCKKGVKFVNFREFVMLVWFFCTIGNNLVYDIDGNGLLDVKEGNIMNQEIYGKFYNSSSEGQRLNEKMQALGKEGVARLFFKEFCKGHPALLKPAEDNINLIKRHTLGHRRWTRMTEYRKTLTRDKFTDIVRFIKLIQDKCGDNKDVYGVEKRLSKQDVLHKKNAKRNSHLLDQVQSFNDSDEVESNRGGEPSSRASDGGSTRSAASSASKGDKPKKVSFVAKKGSRGSAEVLPIDDIE